MVELMLMARAISIDVNSPSLSLVNVEVLEPQLDNLDNYVQSFGELLGFSVGTVMVKQQW